MRIDLVRGSLDLLLLGVLESEELHGYAVIERLKTSSGGLFDLPEGTIYPALHRLEAEGLLTSSSTTVDGRRRRVYAITPEGRNARRSREERWRSFTVGVRRVLGDGP
ncbi:MAG: PadR family transcriptional regulator [Phycicoccus sp.]